MFLSFWTDWMETGNLAIVLSLPCTHIKLVFFSVILPQIFSVATDPPTNSSKYWSLFSWSKFCLYQCLMMWFQIPRVNKKKSCHIFSILSEDYGYIAIVVMPFAAGLLYLAAKKIYRKISESYFLLSKL